MSAPDVPTIDEMQATYERFCAAVDKEDTLGATIYATVCADHVAKLLKSKHLLIPAPEVRDLLCCVSQIFNGWRGCEEWSKWDEEVAQRVVALQRALEPETAK